MPGAASRILEAMKLSIQLYTVRDLLDKDPAGTLKAIGKLGLKYAETAGYAGRPVKEFASMMKDAGLKASGMHVGLEPCEKELDKVIDEANTLGCKYIIVPWIPESLYKEGWDHVGLRLQAVGEKVSKAKKVFCYHNHAFEFVDVNGKTGYDILFSAACPDYVFNQIDLWWAHVGKQDTAKLVEKYGHRVKLVHLKDGLDDQDGKQMPAGKGSIDWTATCKALDKAKVDFGVIEFDTCPGPPYESIKESLDFFRAKGYRD